MEASVQYNDYRGTTAADRSDFLVENPGQMSEYIINKFGLPLIAERFQFVGISVYGTQVDNMSASFIFRNRETKEMVKCYKFAVEMQMILKMFKRFEFQVGNHLEDIDEDSLIEIENDNN